MLSVDSMRFKDRFCASKKGEIGEGGWVSTRGAVHMAAAFAGRNGLRNDKRLLSYCRGTRAINGCSNLSDDDLTSLVVGAASQMATFLAKSLRVCSGLVVLMYCAYGQSMLLLSLERSALIILI